MKEYDALKEYLELPHKDRDITAFVENKMAYLLTDPSISRFLNSAYPEEKKGDALLAFFRTCEFVEINRPHSRNTSPDAYGIYCNFAAPNLRLTAKEFYKFFSGFNEIPLSNNVLNCFPKVLKAIEGIKAAGDSADRIVEFLREIYGNPLSSFVPDPALFLEQDSEAAHIREYRYVDAKNLLAPIRKNIIDALCATLTDFKCNDVALENNAVLQLFASSIDNNSSIRSPVMIVEPTPFLIKSIRGDNPFRFRQIVFVLKDRQLAEFYSLIFQKTESFRFLCLDDLEDTMKISDIIPTDVLFYGTHFSQQNEKTQCLSVILNSIMDKHSLFYYDADPVINNTSSPVRALLCETGIERIWLFPAGIHNATSPERKTLLHCYYGYTDKAESVPVIHFKFTDNGNIQVLSPYMFQASLSTGNVWDPEISFRSEFRKQLTSSQVKSTQTKKAPTEYCYSPEITVFYTLSGEGTKEKPYRLSAYARETSENKTKGSVLIGSEKSAKRAAPIDVKQWIENEYLSDKDVRNAIVNAVLNNNNTSISLRTFIYINDAWRNKLPGNAQEGLKALAASAWGNMYLDKLTAEDIEGAIIENDHCNSIRMNLFSDLFSLAVRQGFCATNPAKKILQQIKIDHEEFYNIRGNLARKNLTEEQFRCAYNLLLKNCKKQNQIHLAAMICLLLGLDANTVCALKWKDLNCVEIPSNEDFWFLQITVQRQFCNDGSEIKEFARQEWYRILPCPQILSNLLYDHFSCNQNQYAGMPIEYKKDAYVFLSEDKGKSNTPISPKKLRKLIREMMKKLRLPPEIIQIPDNAKGTIETDLSYSRGDLFRSNFDYFARYYGNMDNGEIEYLLGNQPSSTFSRNYCDYSNDYSQYILYTKIERIYSKLLVTNDSSAVFIENQQINGSFFLSAMPNARHRTQIGIDIYLPDGADAELIVDAKYGTSITVQNAEEKKK